MLMRSVRIVDIGARKLLKSRWLRLRPMSTRRLGTNLAGLSIKEESKCQVLYDFASLYEIHVTIQQALVPAPISIANIQHFS